MLMNKDLLIDGEKFISAKRAGENLGYSADYIGQLARSGAISGRIVGRSWYVSRRSLQSYKNDSDFGKSIKVGRPTSGKKEIYINGEKFISTALAARDTGYTTDYIGQLIRSGAIGGKMMGRAWYVSRKALLAYKKQNSSPKSVPEPVMEVPMLPVIRSVKKYSPVKPAKVVVKAPKPTSIAYVSEKASTLPSLSKVKPVHDYSHVVRYTVTVSLSIIIIFGVAYSWINFLSPSLADSIDIKVANTMNTADAVFAPVKVGSSELATALGSGVKNFFSGLLSGVTPVPAPQNIAPKAQPAEGVVVTQDTGDHTSVVAKIKSIFSDDVSVASDADGASGIITPVFKESSSTGSYTFVLVPINEKK